MTTIIIMIIMYSCFTEGEIEAQKDYLEVIEQLIKRNNSGLYGFKVHAVSF